MPNSVIYIFLLTQIRINAIINPYGPTVVADYTTCVSGLIEMNFKQPGLLVFAYANNISTSVARIRNQLLKKINEYSKYTIEVKIPRQEPTICNQNNVEEKLIEVIRMEKFEPIPNADYFIIVIDTYTDFMHVAGRISRSRVWNPSAKFILLFFHMKATINTNIAYIEKMLSCLFQYNVINIAVVVPEAKNIRNAIVYSWKPYDPPKFCGYFNETANNRLIIENTCKSGIVSEEKDIFQQRIPHNMGGCILSIIALEKQPFIGGTSDDPNIEKLLIDEVVKHYGIETRYHVVNEFRGERNDEGNWDGALKMLLLKKGHVLLGGVFPDYDVHEDFQCSTTYLTDSYTWVVPHAFKSPPWIAFIIIFKKLVWFCAIIGFFICVLSWRILGQWSNDTTYNNTLYHCFMNTWICLFGFVSYTRPIQQSLRIFYVFFNLYCILFLTAYQTKLIDVLTNPTFEEQIDTIEELVTSGLKYGGSEELQDLFYNSSNAFDYSIGENWVYVYNMSEALINVATHRNFSVLCSRLELAHLSAVMPELSDGFGNYKYFAFERNAFTVPMEMIALRGFAFMNNFTNTLVHLKQAGVDDAVIKRYTALAHRKRAKLLRSLHVEQSVINPLSLLHLEGGFLALGLGFVGGTFTLFIEILLENFYVKSKLILLQTLISRKTMHVFPFQE